MRKFNITKLWNGDPIPDTDSKIRIEISMQVLPITKSLELRIVAPYIGTSDIPDYPAGRCPRLYDFEVVEVFIASTSYHHTDPSTTPYFEIIVGPHGHYLAISHTGQGNLSECDDSILLQNPPPLIQIAPDHQSWSATLQIPYELLPEPVEELHSQFSLNWKFNSYAIHGKGTDRVYMALSPVPGDTPNFHQLEHFVPLTLQDGDPLDYPPAPPLSTTLSSNSCGDIGTVVSNASGTSVVRINTYSVSNNIDSVTKVYTECGSDLQSHIINYYIAPDYTISDGILPKYSSFSMNGIIKQRTTSVDSTTSAISQYSSLYSIPDITNMTSKQQFLRQKSELSVMSTDSVEIAINKENQFNHQYNQISNLKFVNFSMNNIGLYDTISSSTPHDQSGKINHSSIQIDDGYADDDIHNIDYDDNGCKKKETLEQVITRLHEDNSHMCGYIFHENVSYYDTLMHMNEIFDLHLNHSEKILVANLVDRKLVSYYER